jgi:hypothetical protein
MIFAMCPFTAIVCGLVVFLAKEIKKIKGDDFK